MNVAYWVGRKVRIVDGIEGTIGEEGTVLAVDDKPYEPAAWVRVYEDEDSSHPCYRSCDLCWLEDIETGDCGPKWGTGGYAAEVERIRARRESRPA